MPYGRELTVPMGVINDTFESAITWDRLESFHTAVQGRDRGGARRGDRQQGEVVSTRFTHVYPDGPALYYTFRVKGIPAPRRAMARDQDRAPPKR